MNAPNPTLTRTAGADLSEPGWAGWVAPRLKVLIADDHDLFREVLRSFLETEADCAVELAGDLAGALAMIANCGPFEVVLLDFSMPGMNGYDGLERAIAAAGGRPVALMSGTINSEVAERALAVGAAGFLPKTLPARSLVNSIRFMAAGERYVPLDLTRAAGTDGTGAFEKLLTNREQQVLRGLCQGHSNKEIARDLQLSEPTVKLHVKALCRKLDARNRTQAAMCAKQAGFC